MRKIALYLTALLASLVCLVGSAPAEDGAPVLTKPTNCVQIDLDGGTDYVADPAFDTPQCVDGGSGQNYIATFGGHDWVNAKGESDEIHGGDEQDILYGGNEGDRVLGEAGNDFLYAGCPSGCDQTGSTYADVLEGSSGDDTLGGCNNFRTVIRGGQGGYDVGYVDPKKDDWTGLEKVIGC